MKQTAVEWLVEELTKNGHNFKLYKKEIEEAKELEKEQIDNKVFHFAEWLTKKHIYSLMELYNHFEEEFYNETI